MQMAKSILVFGGAQIFTVLAALVRGKLSAILISASGIGLNGLFLTISTFIGNITNFGVGMSAVRSLSVTFENSTHENFIYEVAKIRRISILTALLGAILSLALSPLFSQIYYGNYSNTGSFAALSIVVASSIIISNEMAVLKAMQKTKLIVYQSIIIAVLSVVAVIPFYYYLKIDGVIWALATSSFANLVVTIAMSFSACPFTICKDKLHDFLISIKPIIILGIALIAAGMVSSGAELIIQSYFEATSGLDALGLYRAGYQLSVVYVGMIFTAINNDFYPRLSAISENLQERNIMINRQISVLLFFTVPLIAIFIAILPWIIPLLYSREFDAIITMTRWASISVIIKSIYLPMEYLPLVTGNSRHYLLMETINWNIMAICIIIGNEIYGLDGAGIGLLASQIIEVIWVYFFLHKKYDFSFIWRQKE